MPTIESDAEIGWARSGQAAAESADSEALLREAEAAFVRDEYLTAADILYETGEAGLPCGERADRLADRIRSILGDADRACFDRTLGAGLPPTPESGADGGVAGGRGERRPVGAGAWTVFVLAGWLAVSAIFAATTANEDSFVTVIPWGELFLVFLGMFSLPALVVWLLGYASMRRAQRGHDNHRS